MVTRDYAVTAFLVQHICAHPLRRLEGDLPLLTHVPLFTSLAKGGYVFSSIGLSVCLFVDNITKKLVNGLGWNFVEGSWVVQ